MKTHITLAALLLSTTAAMAECPEGRAGAMCRLEQLGDLCQQSGICGTAIGGVLLGEAPGPRGNVRRYTQTTTPYMELAHAFEFSTEGSARDMVCKMGISVVYTDGASRSGTSIAEVLLTTGIGSNNIRTLVVFKLADIYGGNWTQVSARRFYMLAGDKVVPPSVPAQPCPNQPADICHMMKSPDETLLSNYIGGALAPERSQALAELKRYYPHLEPNMAGE
jgi:hypothetical protein